MLHEKNHDFLGNPWRDIRKSRELKKIAALYVIRERKNAKYLQFKPAYDIINQYRGDVYV